MNPEYLNDPACVRAWAVERAISIRHYYDEPLLEVANDIADFVLNGPSRDATTPVAAR